MNIYITGKFSKIKMVRERAADLERMGHRVTARWLHDGREQNKLVTPEVCAELSANDFDDIAKSDAFIYVFEKGDAKHPDDGMLTELGIAVGLNKSCAIVGPVGQDPQASMFLFLPHIDRFPTWKAFTEHLTSLEA